MIGLILSVMCWLLIFKLDKGSDVSFWVRGGGKSKPPAPAPVDPVAQAQANVNAQIAALPRAARVQWDILRNPEYGLQAQTELYKQARESVFGQEAAVKSELGDIIMQQLLSPTGITEEQQAAIDTRRATAQDELVEAMRNRANVGGGLYGGRSQLAEQRAVQDLQNLFAEEDIGREERNRLNAQQAAFSMLQMLYPEVGMMAPQYINPVVSADQQYAGAIDQANLAAQLEAQERANQSALYQSLFKGLGTAAGGLAGGIGQAGSIGAFFG